MTDSSPSQAVHHAPAWYRCPEIWLLALIVIAVHFSRLTELTIRGEESRRARVAAEMLESGDWIVPHQQGQIYLSRPPLGSWLIALTALVTGEVNDFSTRFPAALATLLTALLIYGYSRQFMSRFGAFAAGLGYSTMVQVLELGRMAETEATLTLLVASSLMLWHAAYIARRHPALIWSVGYFLAALGGLAKGPQGPVYFVAVTGVFLCLQRDWRMLFSRGHAVGIGVFLFTLGLWQVPFFLATDFPSVLAIWGQNAAIRYGTTGPLDMLEHVVTYPLELLACMLPWSVLLVAYADRRFRNSLGEARPFVIFLTLAILVTLPSCLFAIEARTRYFMPLYPCAAPLVALVLERRLRAPAEVPLAQLTQRFVGALGLVAIGAGITVLVASIGWPAEQELTLVQPLAFAVVFATIAMASGAGLWKLREAHSAVPLGTALVLVATLLGLSYAGLRINELDRRSAQTEEQVAKLKSVLPSGAKLVSLGRLHHVFMYHYRDPVQHVSWDQEDALTPEELNQAEYFCFDSEVTTHPELPFAWEEVATVVCDRNQEPTPESYVVVARRISHVATAPDQQPLHR